MDFRQSEDQILLRRSVREFAETEIRPHVREWDLDQHFPSELVPKLAAPDVAKTILERMQRLSQPLGTRIAIEQGVGVIRPSAGGASDAAK